MGRDASLKRQRRAETACPRRHAPDVPPWTPFVRCSNDPNRMLWGGETRDQKVAEIAAATGASPDEIHESLLKHAEFIKDEEVYVNSRYQVNLRRIESSDPGSLPHAIHLSIKRLDKQVPGAERWRDFQRIKNELVGRHCEGYELYPDEDRLVDTANQFHLWVFDEPGFRMPLGMDRRLVSYESGVAGAVQRPLED